MHFCRQSTSSRTVGNQAEWTLLQTPQVPICGRTWGSLVDGVLAGTTQKIQMIVETLNKGPPWKTRQILQERVSGFGGHSFGWLCKGCFKVLLSWILNLLLHFACKAWGGKLCKVHLFSQSSWVRSKQQPHPTPSVNALHPCGSCLQMIVRADLEPKGGPCAEDKDSGFNMAHQRMCGFENQSWTNYLI